MFSNNVMGINRLSRISGHLQSYCCTAKLSTHSLPSKKEIDILGSKMAYIDTEKHSDNVVVFLHGNPTSSFLWRNIIPHVSGIARCLAPDLIGMGHSSKVKGLEYTFQEHFRYLSKWMESVNLPRKINLVIHDWGSGLGFHWANLNQQKVASITHMESLIGPAPSWKEFPSIARNIFQAMRGPDGEELILKQNLFVELLLPRSVIRELSDEEMEAYREPFKEEGESRKPTLTWPRQIPIASDGPEDVVKFAVEWNKWLASSKDIPKLFIDADPGFFSPVIKEKTKDWPNQQVVTVKGLHFIQEDSPDEIGQAIKVFLINKVF